MLGVKRAVGVASILAAMIVSAAALFGGWPGFGLPDQAPESTADRLALVMRWMLVPALSLFFGLGAAHSQRAINPAAADGRREGVGRFMEIVLRYNTNTLEQALLALIAWCGLALVAPADRLVLIPRLALLFGVGRALFFWGYLWTPQARVFGMGLTAYPTYAVLVWLLWRTFQPG
jgi:hypothetical protein